MDIVVAGKDGSGQFSRGEKVSKIRSCVAAAHAASAICIEWSLVLRITRILDKHAAFTCIDAGMARRARGQYAIHHVDPERDIIRDLFRAPHTHQISRLVFRKQRRHFRRHFAGDFVRFADGESADCISGKIDFEKLPGALSAQIRECCALHDSELPLRQFAILLRVL